MKVRPGLEIAGLSDVGCQRENNEDNFGYWEAEDDSLFARLGRLAVVADGMGGAEGGQYASRIAVDTVLSRYSDSNSASNVQERLSEAFAEANTRVQQKAAANQELRGMGTTLTAFVMADHHLYYAHVGDSRLYLLHRGELQQLSHDHSLVARLVESGAIRREDAESHPQKHVLTAAIGVGDLIGPDMSDAPLALETSDTLLLCTDGLWGQVSDDEMAELLASQTPEPACRSLISLAKKRGGPDNITVQIARVS